MMNVVCKSEGSLTIVTVTGIMSSRITPSLMDQIKQQVPDESKRRNLVIDLTGVTKVIDAGTAQLVEVITTCTRDKTNVRWVTIGAWDVRKHIAMHRLSDHIKVSSSVEEAAHQLRNSEAA